MDVHLGGIFHPPTHHGTIVDKAHDVQSRSFMSYPAPMSYSPCSPCIAIVQRDRTTPNSCKRPPQASFPVSYNVLMKHRTALNNCLQEENKLSHYSIFRIVNINVYIILEVKLRVGIKLTDTDKNNLAQLFLQVLYIQ